MLRSLLCLLTLLSLSFASSSAFAECEGKRGVRLDYKIKNIWYGPVGAAPSRFARHCAAHYACYQTLGAKRATCDADFSDALEKQCETRYRLQKKPLRQCLKQASRASTAVSNKGASVYRRLQVRAKADEKKAVQAAASADRKQSAKARRAARRRAAYKKIYDQALGGSANAPVPARAPVSQ